MMPVKTLKCSLIPFCFFLLSCAGNRPAGDASGDSECSECGERGEMELEILDEKGFAEINPEFSKLWESASTLGSFPAAKVLAECPEESKICHSFSADAVDFDLAHFEDSLLEKRFPKMRHEQMLEGLRIPDADSLWARKALEKVLREPLADGLKLSDASPWKSRAGYPTVLSAFDRSVPDSLRAALFQISRRYNVRYLTLPVFVSVKIFPKMGKSGGFAWKSLWTLWDARLGKLMLLSYEEFTAETRSRVAPERLWAQPFAERLARLLSLDPQKIENH